MSHLPGYRKANRRVKLSKALRRVAERATQGEPERRLLDTSYPVPGKNYNAHVTLNDPKTARGLYRTLKKRAGGNQ